MSDPDTAETEKYGIAMVRAELIWAMQPFVDYARQSTPLSFLDGSIFLEPCAMGGVMVAAVSGHAMAVIRDPEGQCSAPMIVDLPTELFDACAPRDPVRFSYCGEDYACPLPAWAQPGTLWLTKSGSFLLPKMRHPEWAEENGEFHPTLFDIISSGSYHHVGRDYRCTVGKTFPWRRPLTIARGSLMTSSTTMTARPEIIGLFTRFRNIFSAGERVERQIWMQTGQNAQVVVTIEGQPDFIGTFMQMTLGEPPDMPAWFESYDADARGNA